MLEQIIVSAVVKGAAHKGKGVIVTQDQHLHRDFPLLDFSGHIHTVFIGHINIQDQNIRL